MKVLHIFNEINYSGAELMYLKAAPNFIANGLELHAMSTGALKGQLVTEFEEAGYKLHHLPIPSQKIKLAEYFVNFVNFIKINQFDLIHIHRSEFYWNFALSARIAGVKSIRTIHNVFKHRWFTKWIGVLNRYTAKKFLNLSFQSISSSVYRNEKNYYGNESILVKNWYNNAEFFPVLNEEERAMSRKNLGIHPDDFVVITVGRCTAEKKHIDLIKAINELKNDQQIRMLHLGEGVTLNCEIEAVHNFNIQDQVLFCGNKKNVRDYLIASDVFAMTSDFEGLGNAAIEAMACQLPVILYDVEGLRELVKDGKNGYLIPSDYKILADKISFLKNNKALCLKMGRVSKTIANQEYSMNTGVEEILRIYQPTLSSALKAQY